MEIPSFRPHKTNTENAKLSLNGTCQIGERVGFDIDQQCTWDLKALPAKWPCMALQNGPAIASFRTKKASAILNMWRKLEKTQPSSWFLAMTWKHNHGDRHPRHPSVP